MEIMLGYEEYRKIIAKALYDNEIINEGLYEKCSKPKYITDLPGDLRTNDVDVLRNRMDAIEEALDSREAILKKAEYRIGVKSRDSERLGKRVEKSIANMDKAVDSINKESDKVVKNISDIEKKLDKASFEDKDLEKKIKNSISDFKKSHNNLFDKNLTGENVKEYTDNLNKFNENGVKLNNILKDALDLKLINKSDLNKSDVSKIVARIDKNINKFTKEGEKINKDVQKVSDNQRDIDYIMEESASVSKEIEVLMDEFEATHNKYMENSKTPYRNSSPNPQMTLNVGAKAGDSFTFLPNNYEAYIVMGE